MTPLQHIIVSAIAVIVATLLLYAAVKAFKDKFFFYFANAIVITIMCLFFAIAHSLKAWW